MVFTIYGLTLSLTPLNDIIVSNISSRIVKRVVVQCLEKLVGNYLTANKLLNFLKVGSSSYRAPVKPIKLSFLYMFKNGKSKFIWSENSHVKIILEKGKKYNFKLILIDSETYREKHGLDINPQFVFDLMSELSSVHEVYGYGRIEIDVNDVEIISSSDLTLKISEINPDTVIIEFKTPTLLQYPKHPRFKDIPSRHTLYPIPWLVILSVRYKWNHLTNSQYIGLEQALYAPYEIIEVGHNVKPITIHVKGIGERGFIGWVKWGLDVRSSRRYENYLKLLKFAEYVGVGRSTTIGLGQVEVTFTKRSKGKESESI